MNDAELATNEGIKDIAIFDMERPILVRNIFSRKAARETSDAPFPKSYSTEKNQYRAVYIHTNTPPNTFRNSWSVFLPSIKVHGYVCYPFHSNDVMSFHSSKSFSGS